MRRMKACLARRATGSCPTILGGYSTSNRWRSSKIARTDVQRSLGNDNGGAAPTASERLRSHIIGGLRRRLMWHLRKHP